MHLCCHFDSCALVRTLSPDFPKSLELLKNKYCEANYHLCAIYQKGGMREGDSLIYQNIAWVKTLIEAEISVAIRTPSR